MILFLYGDDVFSLFSRLKEFIDVAIDRNGDFNVEQVSGVGLSYEDFVGLTSAIPFLGERRLLVVNNLLSGGDSDTCASIATFLKNFSRDDFNIIFSDTGKVDKRKSIYKFLSKDPVKNYFFPFLEGVDLDNFIKDEFLKIGSSVSGDAVFALRRFVGGDLCRMKNEILKLSMYALGRTVSLDDVDLLVDGRVDSSVFDMIDCLSKKDFIGAKKEFSNLIKCNQNEFYLFTMLVFQFRNLVLVKSLLLRRVSSGDIAKIAKLHPFVVKKTMFACSKFEMDDLRSIYESLLDLDLKSKTVSGFSMKRSIDLFMYGMCK